MTAMQRVLPVVHELRCHVDDHIPVGQTRSPLSPERLVPKVLLTFTARSGLLTVIGVSNGCSRPVATHAPDP